MPRRDISSSSSGEEDTDAATTTSPTPNVTEKTSSRYQCPADFVTFCHKPCTSTLTDSLKNENTELWLIKAPASFDPECFSGVKTPLSGLHTLQVPSAVGGSKDGGGGSGQMIYSVLASAQRSSELCFLTGHSRSPGKVVRGPAFSGLLNICETYGDSSANQAPRCIPAAPAPSIPPGLRQRFQPFGSKTPTLTCVAESEADGAATGPSSATLLPRVVKRFPEEDEERRKRKRKKKDRREGEEEEEEAVRVKQEPEVATPGLGELSEIPRREADISPEKRKKKKKKKDREKEEEEEVEAEASVKQEEVTVKSEPMDTSYEDLENSGKKKKKKKKKSKHDED